MAGPPQRYDDGLEMSHYQGMEVHQNDGYQGMEVHRNDDYQGMEVHRNNDYQGMEVHQYPGNDPDETSEKPALHERTYVYDEDPRSRLHRDLKTRQIAMIALGGALGTGLLINT
jgi:amino acid transporter